MIDDLMLTTSSQRKQIVNYIAEILGNTNNITVVTVLGECMNDIEFKLQQMPHIKAWRQEHPNATFEDFYAALKVKAKLLSELSETIPNEEGLK